jgi:hypothetical protein
MAENRKIDPFSQYMVRCGEEVHLLGDTNTIRIFSGLRCRGAYYRRDHVVDVDKQTAKEILAQGKGELISMKFNSLRLTTPTVRF